MVEVQLTSLGWDGESDGEQTITIRDFPCIIGRHPECQRRLADPLVSRRHCVLTLREGQVWIEDLGSRNGTRLNGDAIREAVHLDDGDEVELGGTAFRAHLRTEGVPAGQQGVTVDDPAAQRPVLIVEDDQATARTLATLLESWGRRVRVAHDGPQAIEQAKQDPPEVVFLDIGLPSMSGLEVARRLRADQDFKQTRLVAVTGDEGAMQVMQSRNQFEKLLIKPVPPEVLRDALAHPG